MLKSKFRNRQRALNDCCLSLVAIRRKAGVGKIQQMFMRQMRTYMAQHRQAADAGIKNADRRFGRDRLRVLMRHSSVVEWLMWFKQQSPECRQPKSRQFVSATLSGRSHAPKYPWNRPRP